MYSTSDNRRGTLQQHLASSFHQHEMRDAREIAKSVVRASPESNSMTRVKSLFSLSPNLSIASSSSSIESNFEEESSQLQEPPLVGAPAHFFTLEMRQFLDKEQPNFNHAKIRKVMEPHLRRARLLREQSRKLDMRVDASIASSMGVPYTALRQERPFLFDDHTCPLHRILAETLGIADLTLAHHVEPEKLLVPLLDRERRHHFHSAYDNFVTSFCIPLLHSMAISKHCFQDYSSSRSITYRYQAFPNIQVHRPGCAQASSPTCDSTLGHSIGCLTFHVPLTPCQGTNCLYTESHPGKEDWHPLACKSVGLGYLIDGARCLYFDLENTTEVTRISLTFRVLIYHGDEGSGGDGGGLCPSYLLEDAFTARPGYYEEAVIDLGRRTTRGLAEAVVKKHGDVLMDPDYRVGYPFV